MEQKLRGLVGQEMGGRRGRLSTVLKVIEASSGAGTIVVPQNCTALIFAIGGGGSGTAGNSGGNPGGGGGGAALYKRVSIAAGQSISYTVGAGGAAAADAPGNAGGDTIVTLPGSQVLRAGGGLAGMHIASVPGGTATGGDVNRAGGFGGPGGGSGGSGGVGGGVGGSGSGGGGGSAGFGDVATAMLGGAGSAGMFGIGPSNAGAAPGGGSGSALGGGSVSGAGGAGRLLVVLVKEP